MCGAAVDARKHVPGCEWAYVSATPYNRCCLVHLFNNVFVSDAMLQTPGVSTEHTQIHAYYVHRLDRVSGRWKPPLCK